MKSYSGSSLIKYEWEAEVEITVRAVRTTHVDENGNESGSSNDMKFIERYINTKFKREGKADDPEKQSLMDEIVETIRKKSGIIQTNAWFLFFLLLIAVAFVILGVLGLGPDNLKSTISIVCYAIAILLIVLLCVLGARASPIDNTEGKSSVKRVEKYMEKHKNSWEVTLNQVGYEMNWKIEERKSVKKYHNPFTKKDGEAVMFYPYMEIYFSPLGMGGNFHQNYADEESRRINNKGNVQPLAGGGGLKQNQVGVVV